MNVLLLQSGLFMSYTKTERQKKQRTKTEEVQNRQTKEKIIEERKKRRGKRKKSMHIDVEKRKTLK